MIGDNFSTHFRSMLQAEFYVAADVFCDCKQKFMNHIKKMNFKEPEKALLLQRKIHEVLSICMKNLNSIRFVFCLGACLFIHAIQAQNNRISTQENIAWHNVFTTVKLNEKFGFHGEYQWRRVDFGARWQQSLLRTGINYNLNERVQFRVGYAWVETFAYGEYPINVFAKNFTEHRAFQMVQLLQKEGRVDIQHRFMLEQRFVGKYDHASRTKEDDFLFMNRMRYMLRVQLPLKGNTIADKTPYLAMYNELFICFGENVNANVFDQNRLGLLLGYRINSNFRIEAGYLNQILQFGRQIEGKNVFQYNSGLIVNAYISF